MDKSVQAAITKLREAGWLTKNRSVFVAVLEAKQSTAKAPAASVSSKG